MSLAKVSDLSGVLALPDVPAPKKPRSDSSPAKLSSQGTPASPLMKSPQAKVPRLNLSLTPEDTDAVTPPESGGKTAIPSSEPTLKSPKSPSRAAPNVRFAASSVTIISTSAPTTPRTKSARQVDDLRSPRRHRIDSSPRKTPDWRKFESGAGLQVVPSPRKLNDELILLGAEAAKLIFTELRAKNPKLTKAVILELARFETQIPLDKLSAGLRARVTDEGRQKISHAKLIKGLFLPLLIATEVGKTMIAMRLTVMSAYEGNSLTLVDVEMREAEDPGFKKRLEDNLEPQGMGCARLIFGLSTPELSASKLPAELIAFWKVMDAELCDWAQQNPDLPLSELKSARANLGFDLLFTRLVLAMASGPKEDACLAIPALFFKSVKNALLKDWPKFVDSFISAGKPACPTVLPVAASSSTRAVPVTTAAPDPAEPRPKSEVSQE